MNAKLGASVAAAGLFLYVVYGHHPVRIPKMPDLVPAVTAAHVRGGTLNCSGLEKLWEQAGGSHGEAFTAAEVAMAESSGQQDVTGPVGERGYWQIAPFNAGSSYDPMTNAKAAVRISGDGRDWNPWTTYRTGAYQGKC